MTQFLVRHHQPERHGTMFGIFGLLLLIGVALIMTLELPSHERQATLHNAAAVAW